MTGNHHSQSVMLKTDMELRYTPDEMDLFARLVYAEAAGEPELGQIAVAASVLNRIADPRYHYSLEAVIMENSSWRQRVLSVFPVLDGRIWELDPSPAGSLCRFFEGHLCCIADKILPRYHRLLQSR